MAGSLDMPRREGRAPRMQAAARRAQILAEAVRVFSDSGYGATSTAAIAQNCGISEPALYRYFSSKRELYLAALDEASARVLRRWQEISKESGGALGGLLAIGQWYFLQVEEEPELLRLRAGSHSTRRERALLWRCCSGRAGRSPAPRHRSRRRSRAPLLPSNERR